MTKYKYLFKTVKTIVALLCIGAIVFDLLPIGAVKAVNLGSENESIAAEFRENQSPNFFTTWMMQYTSSNAPTAFDRLNDENLFGENGWARTLYPEARSEMYFVLDWGWDLPDSRTYTGDQQDFIGTDILDPGKFPYEGDAAQRLATLNQKITDLGWKGTGLWIYSQEPEGQRSSTDGKPWNEAFWRARLEESKAAGIALWKIDFGEYFHNSEWHRFITELAQEVYPELLIERSIGGSNGALNGGTGGRERTGFADEAAYMLSYSDLYKTYDVSDHLHTAVSLERIGQILLAAYMEEGSAGGWIDSHDMPYMSASLGTTIETLRANRYEVARLVAWQKDYAPAYAAGEYDTKLSGEYFADDWTFLRADEDWTGNPLGNVVQRAPSAIARGIELPTASVDSGDRPYLTASRNPNGAISIATHPRTHDRTLDQAVYADVNFPVGDLTGPIGVFGYYRSLTLNFSASVEGKRIYARDILSETLMDITDQVTVDGCSLTVPGTLIETIGISGAGEGDPGAPGLYLQIGEGDDYLPAPAINERSAVWDIPNSSFETYDSDIHGADYDPLAVKPRPVNYTITDLSAFCLTEGGHSGEYAASHTADRSFSVITSTKKYVLPKGFYTASVWVKTSGLGAGDTARLVALDGLTELASVDILALAEGHDLTEWTKVTLPDFFVRTALTLDITTSGSAGSALLFDDLTLLPVSLEEEDALVSNIKVDGLSIQEYRSDRGEYTVPVLLSQEELPVVTVTHREDAEVTITQASFVPGEAVIRAKCGEEEKEYTIRFTVKDSVYLSDLNFSKAISGWGTPTRDLSVEGEAISLQMPDGQTRTFAKGIGVNADSEVTLQIEGSDYSVFEAYVGIQTGKPTVASVEFIVKLDGEIAYRSGRMTSTTPAKRICIDVQGAKEITLMVNCLDTIDWDVANWADARFCVKGSLPLEQLSPISSSETETSYDISSFAATTFSAELSGDNGATFRILADGETLLDETLTATDGPKKVTVNVKDVSILTLMTEGEASWENAVLILDAIGYDKLITGVYADSQPLEDYAFYRTDYNMLLESTSAPTLTVEHLPEAEVTVTQAAAVPGTATVTVTYGKESWDFTVRFLRNSSEIYLSDMQWSNAEASYGYVQRDQSVEGKPLELLMNGSSRTFSKGVGFNATAQLDVNISGLGFKTFTAYVGVEPAAGKNGTINYKVYVDGYCAYESGVMDGTDDAKLVAINVEGASVISLVADCVDNIIWDHGAWADAKFSTREYQFGAWSSEDHWLLSNQDGFAAIADGEVLEPLVYGNLLQEGIDISYDVEYYSNGDVPDDAGFEFYNASSGIRIGGRVKGVHDEVSIDLIYCLPGGNWKTVYESPRWIASGKNVHVQLTNEPGEDSFTVIVSNDTGILIDQTVTFPDVTDENFYSYGDGLQFSFHNDNPSQFKVSNIFFGRRLSADLSVKPGDANSDGEVDVFDIYAIRKHISGEATLTGNNLLAADSNFDDVVDSTDLVVICDHIFGVSTLPDSLAMFLNKTILSMKAGEQFALTANNAAGAVVWNTDNSAVATVEDGVVTAIGAGTAIITADDGVSTASCLVLVEDGTVSISKYWTMPGGWIDASEGDTLAFTGSGTLGANVYKESFKGNENLHIAFDVTHDPNVGDSSLYFTLKAPSQSEFLRFEFQWGPQSPSYLSNANVVLNRGANYGYAWQLISSTGLTWTGSTYHIEIDWDAATKQLTLTRSGDPSDTQTATITCEIPSAAGTAGENFFDNCGEEDLQLEMNTWTGSFTISNFTLSNESAELSFTLSETAKTMKVGEQFTLSAENAVAEVSWSSDNSAVAAVENGVVTAIGAGTTVITATDGVNSATCIVTVESENISQYWTMPEGWADASQDETLAFTGSGSLSPNVYKESFKGSENLHMAFDVTPDPNATESSFYFTIKAPSQSEFLRFEFQWGPQSPSYLSNANVVLNRGANYGYAWQLISSTGLTWTGSTYHIEIDWDAATKQLTLTRSGDPSDTQTATITCEIPSAAGTAGENFFDNCGEEELQLEMNTWTGSFTISNFTLSNESAELPFTLSETAKTMKVGEQFTLSAENAVAEVSWSSDNSAVAAVENGVVTAIGAGTAVITATDGVNSATCIVTVESENISQYWTMPEGWADASQDETLAFTGSGSLSPNVYKESFKGSENLHMAFDVKPDPNATESSFYFTIKAPSQSEFLRFEFQWGPQSPSHICNANVVLNRGADYGYAWQLINGTGWSWTGMTYHVEIDWDAATKKLTLTKSGDPADTQTASITCEIPSAAGTAGENFFDNCGEEELQLEMNTWAGGFTISNFELENIATQKTAKTKNASESDDELGVALNLSKATLIPGETIVATVDLENYDLFSETNGITDMQVEVLWNTDVVEYVDNSALCLNSVANGTTYQNAAYNSDKEKLVYLFYDTEDMPLNESTAGLCSFELRVNDQVADGASADFSVILKYVDSQGRQETVYTDITGSAQWSFHDKDPNWHYDENGDLYHFLNGEEATFLPAIDASKGFSISFDLWFDMSKCRTDFPTFTMKLVDTDSTDYFFSRIRISSYNKEWLVEPQFYNGSWQDLSFSDSWLKGWHGIDDTVHVELERPANSDQLIYTISSGDIQLATGNIYADAMADLLSGKLRLVVGLDYPGNDVVKLSEFSIISGDRQLFNPGSGGTALPEYDTFNGDTDTRGTNFSSGDIQYTLEQVLPTAPDTIEAWVKVLPNTSDGKIGAIFSNYEHDSYPNCTRLVTLEVGEGGKPNLVWSYDGTTQSYTANTDIRTGRWTHIAYTRDLNAGKVYCYIDGEKVGVWTIQTELKGEKAPSEIHSIGGSWLEGNPCYFLGSIADVRVYSACRSQEQILADMSDSASYEEETLLGAWSLEGERGTEDLSLYGNDIQLYEGEWISYTSEPGDYSFVVLPDTQNMLLQYPDNENSDYFEALIDWILENKEAENIQFVMHLGDVFNKTSNTHEQEVNQEILNRLYENLPWAFCLGNHDYDSYSPRDTTLVNQFYPLSSFRTMETFGGSYDETVDNTYHLLEVQGNKYLIMTLEFGPRDQVVQWANEVIAAHADYQVILMTHGYLMNNQEYLYDQCNAPSIYGVEGNDPDQLWDKLVSRHENIIMILSGHISDDEINYLPRAGVNGNIVWQVQMDMQNYDRDAGAGLLAMLRFRDGGKTIDVQYYSPYRDASYRIMNQISIDLNPETYTVSWNVEGNISSEEYTKGIMPVYRGVPEKISADPEVKYVFTGWDQELTPVLQDVTYTAQFKEVTTVAKTPGDFGWDTDETDGSKNFAGWTSTDGTDLTAVYSDTVGNHRVWKELLTNPKEFTLTATADVDEQSSVYLKVLGQTLELDGRNGDGDQVGVKLNGVFQEWVKATACTADISIRRIDGGSLLITVSGDETKTYTITPYDTGKNVEIGIYGGTMQLTNLVVKSVQEDDPGVTVSPQEFGWDNDSGDFSGWTATDEFNLSVVRADAACERVWKGLLTDLDNFTIDLDVTNDNTSSTYIKVLGVTIELDSNNGDGNQTFMKVGGTNYDWLAGNGCKFHVTITRENGGDLTVTVTGAGNETPFTATVTPTESNENVELGLYRGISRFENITVVSGEAEPTEVAIKISHTVSFDSDLQMNYRIKLEDILAAIPNYVTDGAYLTVEKDRYPMGGGEKTVETVTLYPDLTTDAERMLFNLAGIQSVEMGSELRAVLHFFDAEGNEYYTTVDIYSVLAYAELCFDYYDPATDGYLFTMLIDCLNYGAAAQVAFDRRADEPVNAGLEAYQQYASTELSAELTDVRTYVDNDRTITAVTAMGFTVTFADKTEINAKLTIAEGYTKEDITSVKVLNESGEEVAVLTEFTELDDGRLQVTFTGVKSVNMRDMYYFVAYVGEEVASQNVGYSIEAYAKSNIASTDANAANLAKACIYYGDSAKIYFDSLIK